MVPFSLNNLQKNIKVKWFGVILVFIYRHKENIIYMTMWRYEISFQVLKYFSTRGILHLHTAMSDPVFINFLLSSSPATHTNNN